MPDVARARSISTRMYLFGLVAAVVIPLLAFAGFLVTRYAAAERVRFERDAVQLARHIAFVVDGELAGQAAKLRGLASSAALVGNDLALFHQEAKWLVEGRDEIVVLRELAPVQLVNTERPYGEPLPAAVSLPQADLAAFRAGRSVVTGVYRSPLSGEHRVAVAIPVSRTEGEPYILAITFPTTRIRDVLASAAPRDWLIGIGDRAGIIVTRSAMHEEYSGRPGLPEFLRQAQDRSGSFASIGFDGYRQLTGYYRSDFSEWLYAANIPEAVVGLPLRNSLTAFAAAGLAALVLSAILAFTFGTTFTRATAALVDRATALGQGRSVQPIESRLSELVLVSNALSEAASAIEQRTREQEKNQEQRQLLINELNHRVKNTLVTVQSIVMQTLRGSPTTAATSEALTNRLLALAKAHDILTRESWEGAELKDVILQAVGPHGDAERFDCEGPSVWLPPSLSLALSLALHELATNASKYGSLSAAQGSVAITWDVDDKRSRLVLRWTEKNGPPVTPPVRRGFGSRLIERSFSADTGGTVTVEYLPAGLVCVIEAPLEGTRPN
jgi:two-component sensor histidine kinase